MAGAGFSVTTKIWKENFILKCSSQIQLCVNCLMQNRSVSVLNINLEEISRLSIWDRFSPHLPLHSFINFYWISYSLQKLSFPYLHVGPDVGISTFLCGLLPCTLLFILKVKRKNTIATFSLNIWTLNYFPYSEKQNSSLLCYFAILVFASG